MATALEPEEVVTFQSTPVQDRLWGAVETPGVRLIGFGCGIRGTKTWGSLATLLSLCRFYPGSRWHVVRKDIPRLHTSTIPSFEKLAPLFGRFVASITQHPYTVRCANGSVIAFVGENLDEDPELQRFHGFETNGFLLDDGDELAERTFVKCIERAGTWIVPNGEQQPPPYVFATFNPCQGWPRRRFYAPWKAGTLKPPYAFVPSTAADNPYVSDEQREAWQQMSPYEHRRFVLGDWEAMSGAYYDTLTPDVLIDRAALPEKLPETWRYWGAFDWGYRHWSVMGAWATTTDGLDILLDSLWLRKLQDDELALAAVAELPAACLKLVYAGHDCWAKPIARAGSGESTSDVFARVGKILLVRADIDPVNGGRAVNGQLKRRGVKIVKTPGNLRVYEQLGEIVPDPDDVRKPLKVDADEHGQGGDDGADCFRYAIATRIIAQKHHDTHIGRDDHKSVAYDFVKHQQPHVTVEDQMQELLRGPKNPTQGLNRVPRW